MSPVLFAVFCRWISSIQSSPLKPKKALPLGLFICSTPSFYSYVLFFLFLRGKLGRFSFPFVTIFLVSGSLRVRLSLRKGDALSPSFRGKSGLIFLVPLDSSN